MTAGVIAAARVRPSGLIVPTTSYADEVMADNPIAWWRHHDAGPPAATAASTSYAGDPVTKAFDGVAGTHWSTAAVTTGWVQATLAEPAVLTQYSLKAVDTSTGSVVSRMPRDWTLEGSHDGVAWDVLDTQAGVSWTSKQGRTYPIANATAYLRYRLNIAANNGDSTYISLAEFGSNVWSNGVVDSSGNHLNGAFAPGVTLRQPSMLPNVPDGYSVAYSGAGMSSVTHDAAFNAATAAEAWALTTASIDGKHLFAKGDGGSWTGFALTGDAAGQGLRGLVVTSGTANEDLESGIGGFNDGQPHHFVLGLTPGVEAWLMIDGVVVATSPTTLTTFPSSSQALRIGGINTGVARYFTGRLQEVALYDGLTQERAAAHYAAAGLPADPPAPAPSAREVLVLSRSPLAYYRHGERRGAVMGDQSGNSRHGKYQGAVVLKRPGAVLGDADTAVALDGANSRGEVAYDPWMQGPFATLAIEQLFKPRTLPAATDLLLTRSNLGAVGDGNYQFYLKRVNAPTASYGLLMRVNGSQKDLVSGPVGLAKIDQWADVVGVYDGAWVRLYVDGQMIQYEPASGALAPGGTLPLYVGPPGAGTAFGPDGDADESVIYPSLTPEQVVELWRATVSGNHWPLRKPATNTSGTAYAALTWDAELAVDLTLNSLTIELSAADTYTLLIDGVDRGSQAVAAGGSATWNLELALTAGVHTFKVQGTANRAFRYGINTQPRVIGAAAPIMVMGRWKEAGDHYAPIAVNVTPAAPFQLVDSTPATTANSGSTYAGLSWDVTFAEAASLLAVTMPLLQNAAHRLYVDGVLVSTSSPPNTGVAAPAGVGFCMFRPAAPLALSAGVHTFKVDLATGAAATRAYNPNLSAWAGNGAGKVSAWGPWQEQGSGTLGVPAALVLAG